MKKLGQTVRMTKKRGFRAHGLWQKILVNQAQNKKNV